MLRDSGCVFDTSRTEKQVLRFTQDDKLENENGRRKSLPRLVFG